MIFWVPAPSLGAGIQIFLIAKNSSIKVQLFSNDTVFETKLKGYVSCDGNRSQSFEQNVTMGMVKNIFFCETSVAKSCCLLSDQVNLFLGWQSRLGGPYKHLSRACTKKYWWKSFCKVNTGKLFVFTFWACWQIFNLLSFELKGLVKCFLKEHFGNKVIENVIFWTFRLVYVSRESSLTGTMDIKKLPKDDTLGSFHISLENSNFGASDTNASKMLFPGRFSNI